MTSLPVLANNGAMSTFVGAFDVTSKLTGNTFQCRFSNMWNGIGTRHADTIDTKFFVDGKAVVLGLSHKAFVKFRERTGRDLTDREASFIAAEFLRERLEEEDERLLYDVYEPDVLRLIDQGLRVPSGAGVGAAVQSYTQARSEAVGVSR